jgi:hypothetical protein
MVHKPKLTAFITYPATIQGMLSIRHLSEHLGSAGSLGLQYVQ